MIEDDPKAFADLLVEEHGQGAATYAVERLRELATSGEDECARHWAAILREVRGRLAIRKPLRG